MYAHQNTKYVNQNTQYARQFLSRIYALFWRTFYRPKNMVVYQNDKVCWAPLPASLKYAQLSL